MPELPEVHTILQDLKQAGLIGQKIEQVEVFWNKIVHTPSIEAFYKQLPNQTITAIERRGKYIVFHLTNHLFLIVHLRMTGKLLLGLKEAQHSPYIRLQLNLSHDKQLLYHDTRKFGRWYLVKDIEEILGRIGPEPLHSSFSLKNFSTLLKSRKRALKPLLLDQTFLAGLGNIYVDEALWEACLHPLQPANQLSQKEVVRLYHSIRLVLQKGIDAQGTTLGSGRTNYYRLDGSRGHHQNQLNVFRRTGQPCPRCGHTIERGVVAQRSTHICPNCQQQK